MGVTTIDRITPVAGGSETALWRVEHDQMTSALRVFFPHQAETYRRELRAMQIAAAHSIPVPAIRAHGFWHDRPALLLAWCDGEPLAEALQRQPWRVLRLGRALGQMQAKLHQISVDDSTDAPTADWITWHNAVDAGLAARLRDVAGDARQLLHLDYHPLNVLTNARGVSAVLDWANARAGDSRADVARTYTILVVEPSHPTHEPIWFRIARRFLAQMWLNGYQSNAGPLQHMPLFYAWAGAVMQADLAPRVQHPDSWWQPHHLHAIQHWTQHWRKQV